MSLRPVKIVGTGSFLPGPPVTNDQLETVLGPLTNAPKNVERFVANLGPRTLEKGGIQTRHFAVDPETGDLTHTFASLAEEAARKALEMAGMEPGDVHLLIIACPSYDYSTPPTSTVLQERLGIKACAEMEIHSNCSGVGKGVQIAYDALRIGRYETALVCYSQLSSVYLRSCYMNQGKINKVNAALRWILADGSGAVLLKASDNTVEGQEIIGTHVESVGADRPPGMTAGGAVCDLVRANHQIPQLYDEGAHHLWQDFTAVHEGAAPLLLEGVARFAQKLQVPVKDVDHLVVSIPTVSLYEKYIEVAAQKLGIRPEQAKFRSGRIGYCGGAATLLHLDEMVRTGELQHGQLALVHAVESSKWMTAGFAVRW